MSFLSGIGLKLALAAAVVGGVILILLGAKRAGRATEKVEQIERNSTIRRRQDAVENPDPYDVDDILGRL